MLKAAGHVLTSPGGFELAVAAAEMALLSQAPWSHDDRLLSAFELAHGRLRDHGLDVERRLRRQTRAMFHRAADLGMTDPFTSVGPPSHLGGADGPRVDRDNGRGPAPSVTAPRSERVNGPRERTIELR